MIEYDDGFKEYLKNCKMYHKGNVFSEVLKDELWECWCKAVEFASK